MEGALEFITSDDAIAGELRDKVVFLFTPMLDPDGCATGQVRFNANGYDVNRHWDEVDLRSKSHLERMPEIWYVEEGDPGIRRLRPHHRRVPQPAQHRDERVSRDPGQ